MFGSMVVNLGDREMGQADGEGSRIIQYRSHNYHAIGGQLINS